MDPAVGVAAALICWVAAVLIEIMTEPCRVHGRRDCGCVAVPTEAEHREFHRQWGGTLCPWCRGIYPPR
jgi:hypothetical protein